MALCSHRLVVLKRLILASQIEWPPYPDFPRTFPVLKIKACVSRTPSVTDKLRQLFILPPEDICIIVTEKGRYHWHLVRRDQGYCKNLITHRTTLQ